ncbi:hypothetical protein DW265_09865 [Dorea longicatena]|uniref:HNH endonuclease n=1 Tax=Dorea longicatena TaxID=88431 RepID=A0A414ST86_9FIRM|nr:hypothetical protein [Dorea longicatena]RHG24665.1 hypothetical protein DW265_09865 [Dorea longicatena]
MANEIKINENVKTKVCKCCGRELPLSEFTLMYGKNHTNTCKECVNKKQRDSRKKSNYKKGLQQYLTDDSMHIKRQYKEINGNRILRKKVSGIKHCTRDEKFVKLFYYKDTWISNYGRCIVLEDGEYKLLKGNVNRQTGELVYTLRKEKYLKTSQTYVYKKKKVMAASLVIETFVVNYDMTNNIMIWHLNNDVKDLCYRHLYPVTEKQYKRLTELQEQSSEPLSEDVIMDVINAVEYKQDDWNPWYYRRSYEERGYIGMKQDYQEQSYLLWKNVIQRCYNKKIHVYKPEYKDKSVCEEWLNYANFKLWYDEHFISAKNNQIDLDKDLLVQGNTNYSPETCVFLVHYQNLMFEGKRGNCVYVNKDGTFSVDGKKNNSYKTYEEALEFVIVRQIEKIESIAEKCKGTIPMCAYEAMLNWDVRLAMCG